MRLVRLIYGELAGMFVDDGKMALFALVLIAIVTGLVELVGLPALWGAIGLLVGSMVILVDSVLRANRRS